MSNGFANNFKESILNVFKNERVLLLVSFLISFILILVLSSVIGVEYSTNDDSSIQQVLSGDVLGTPYPFHQFIGVVLGILISKLYAFCNQINWWRTYHLFIIFCGYSLILYCVLKNFKVKDLLVYVFLLIYILLFILILNTKYLSFVTSPSVLSAGLIMFSLDYLISNNKYSIIFFVFQIFTLLIIVLTRHEVGLTTTFLLAMCESLALLNSVHEERFAINSGIRLRILKSFARILIVAFLVFFVNKFNSYILKSVNGVEFEKFNIERANFTDYPKLPFNDNRELFDNIGWSETTYALCSDHFFMMDKEYNTNNLSLINRREKKISISFSTLTNRLMILIKPNLQNFILFFSYIFCIIFYISLLRPNHVDIYDICFFVCNLFFSLFFIYIVYKGRVIYRGLFSFIAPIVLLIFLLSLKKTHYFKLFHVVLCAISIVVLCTVLFVAIKRSAIWRSGAKERLGIEIEYLNQHKENVYIAGIDFDFYQYNVFCDRFEYPTNIIPWGTSLYHSDLFNRCLAMNGTNCLDCNILNNSNTYYVTNIKIEKSIGSSCGIYDLNCSELFFNHLKEKHSISNYKLVDSVGDLLYVYDFD